MKLRVGISTCPNDTFLFHGILSGAVRDDRLDIDIHLADVQELNEGFAAGRFDIAKGSFFAALKSSSSLTVLPVGSAVGFGVGPVLLRRGGDEALPRDPRVLTPGPDTTAHLLLRCLRPEYRNIGECIFSEIMPSLRRGDADLGVCIHEGRFTYEEEGLHLEADLGAEWESQFAAPLPLGGLFASRHIDDERIHRFVDLLRRSLAYAWSHPEATYESMRKWAVALDDPTLWKHVELYVDERTADLGKEGRAGLNALRNAALKADLIPSKTPSLQIFGESKDKG